MESLKTKSKARPRDRVLETAARLFYEHGIRAVGVDRVVAESGVGKATLYRHFPTKDDLMVAALELRHEPTIAFIKRLAEEAGETPRERLLGFFGQLEEAFGSPGWHGCAFANATLELHDPSHPAREVAERHKRETADVFERLACEAGVRHPRELAEQLVMVLDGVMVATQVQDDPSVARSAARAARAIVEAHLPAVHDPDTSRSSNP